MGELGGIEFHVPNFIIHISTVLGFINNLISFILCFINLKSPSQQTESSPLIQLESSFTALRRKLRPVVKFSELVDLPDTCIVCLDEFEARDEVCQLSSCKHVFHQCCIDRWIDHDRNTCPLCLTPFMPKI